MVRRIRRTVRHLGYVGTCQLQSVTAKLLLLIGKERFVKPLKHLNRVLRAVVSSSHRQQRVLEWGIPPQPEWFDHYIDLYSQWHSSRHPFWLERGCFGLLACAQGANVLELCCG